MNIQKYAKYNEFRDIESKMQCIALLDRALKAYVRAKPFTNSFASEKSISSADLITVAFLA